MYMPSECGQGQFYISSFLFILSLNGVSGTPNLFICCMHMWIQLFALSDSLCVKCATAPAVMWVDHHNNGKPGWRLWLSYRTVAGNEI